LSHAALPIRQQVGAFVLRLADLRLDAERRQHEPHLAEERQIHAWELNVDALRVLDDGPVPVEQTRQPFDLGSRGSVQRHTELLRYLRENDPRAVEILVRRTDPDGLEVWDEGLLRAVEVRDTPTGVLFGAVGAEETVRVGVRHICTALDDRHVVAEDHVALFEVTRFDAFLDVVSAPSTHGDAPLMTLRA